MSARRRYLNHVNGELYRLVRQLTLPGRNLILFSVGFTYEILADTNLQAAFLHEFGVGARGINYSSSPSAGTLIGSYNTSASVISVGLNLRF